MGSGRCKVEKINKAITPAKPKLNTRSPVGNPHKNPRKLKVLVTARYATNAPTTTKVLSTGKYAPVNSITPEIECSVIPCGISKANNLEFICCKDSGK